jgi:hypothetical protein
MICHPFDAGLLGAVRAAKKGVVRLYAVTDDLAPAMGADRGKFMYRALKTVENVAFAGRYNFE